MLSKDRKRYAFWCIVAVFAVLLVGGPLALRFPVPAKEYRQCEEAAQKAHTKQPQCERDEPGWQRTISDPVAYFTLWLTVFTGVLGAMGLAQIRLSRDEFNATHRPQLVMGPIQLVEFAKGKPIKIHWAVTNIGTGRGKIVESNASVMFQTEPLPAEAPYSAERSSMNTGEWIDSGCVSTTTADFIPSFADWVTFEVSQSQDMIKQRLFFFGFVLYEAAGGKSRSFAFCRRYNSGSARFEIVEDNIYEHSA